MSQLSVQLSSGASGNPLDFYCSQYRTTHNQKHVKIPDKKCLTGFSRNASSVYANEPVKDPPPHYLTSAQLRKKNARKRLEDEPPSLRASIATTSFIPYSRHTGNENLHRISGIDPSGYTKNLTRRTPFEASIAAAKKEREELQSVNFTANELRLLRCRDPTAAENEGRGPKSYSSVYNSSFNRKPSTAPGGVESLRHVIGDKLDSGNYVVVQEDNGFTLNCQPYVPRPPSAPEEPLQLTDKQKREAMVSKRLEYEGNVKGSIYKSDYKGSKALTGSEPLPNSNIISEEGSYSRSVGLKFGLTRPGPEYRPRLAKDMHPISLQRTKVQDPAEYQNLIDPNPFYSTTQAAYVPREFKPLDMTGKVLGKKEPSAYTINGMQEVSLTSNTFVEEPDLDSLPELYKQKAKVSKRLEYEGNQDWKSIQMTSFGSPNAASQGKYDPNNLWMEESGYTRNKSVNVKLQQETTNLAQPDFVHPKVAKMIKMKNAATSGPDPHGHKLRASGLW